MLAHGGVHHFDTGEAVTACALVPEPTAMVLGVICVLSLRMFSIRLTRPCTRLGVEARVIREANV